jgi:hypothetical protein
MRDKIHPLVKRNGPSLKDVTYAELDAAFFRGEVEFPDTPGTRAYWEVQRDAPEDRPSWWDEEGAIRRKLVAWGLDPDEEEERQEQAWTTGGVDVFH